MLRKLFCLSLNLLLSPFFLSLSNSLSLSLSLSHYSFFRLSLSHPRERQTVRRGIYVMVPGDHNPLTKRIKKLSVWVPPHSLSLSLSLSLVFTEEYGINKIEVIESCFVSLEARIYSIWLNFRKLFFQHKEPATFTKLLFIWLPVWEQIKTELFYGIIRFYCEEK